jgi:hypothetical protein
MSRQWAAVVSFISKMFRERATGLGPRTNVFSDDKVVVLECACVLGVVVLVVVVEGLAEEVLIQHIRGSQYSRCHVNVNKGAK